MSVNPKSETAPAASPATQRAIPSTWTRLQIARYALVGCALAVGVWFLNGVGAIGLAVAAYLSAPFLAHPGDALRYLRRRGEQRQYVTELASRHGEVVAVGESAKQIRQAIAGEIKPFRVFVSSTFRDLAPERDLLAKDVFPRLANECDRRGAVWAPIDLRWGITELQQNAGEVIRICLGSVERSRPNTIGIVGTRYGTHLPFTPRDLESLPAWITQDAGLSVTHLELRHATHSDPAAVTIFVMDRPRVGGAEREGIDRMITEFTQVGAQIVDGVVDAPQLAALVEGDLLRRLDEQVPDVGLDNRMLREISAHILRERMLAERPALNAGVPAVASRHLAEGNVVVLRGATGSGRSTQLAAWAHAWREKHPDDIVVCRFVGLTDASQTWAGVLRSIVAEISIRTGRPMRLPERDEELGLSAGFRFLETQSMGRVVVGIDGLDRFQAFGEWDQRLARSLAWVPQKGAHNRLRFVPILATDDLRDDAEYAYPTAVVRLPSLSPADRATLVEHSLASVDRRLPDRDIKALVEHAATGNPAFLGLLLDELHKVPSQEELGVVLRELLSAGSLDDLVDQSLDRVEREVGADRVSGLHAVLALLADSTIGYTEIEIVDVVSRLRSDFSQTDFSMLRWRLANLLFEADGAFQVAAPFSEAVKRRINEADFEGGLHKARVACFAYGPRRFTTRSVRELASYSLGDDIGVLRDIVAEPRGLLALRAAVGSEYHFALGGISRLVGCRVSDMLVEAVSGLNHETPDVGLGVAEVCFDSGHYDLTMRALDCISRENIANDALLLDRYFALLGKLDLVDERRLSEREWEEIFDHGCRVGSANVQLALSGLGAAVAGRGDFFWAKKYSHRAVDAAFASGDTKGVARAGVNSAIMSLEGIADPLRSPIGPMLRKLLDKAATAGFLAGDLRLLMAGLFRRSVMDLILGDATAAHDGFVQVDQMARQMGDQRWLRFTRLALASTLTVLGRRPEALRLAEDARVSLDEAAALLEREVLTLLT